MAIPWLVGYGVVIAPGVVAFCASARPPWSTTPASSPAATRNADRLIGPEYADRRSEREEVGQAGHRDQDALRRMRLDAGRVGPGRGVRAPPAAGVGRHEVPPPRAEPDADA